MTDNPYESPRRPLCSPERRSLAPASASAGMIAAGQVATGFSAAFAIWAFTAPKEAWDANNLYSVWILSAGLIASFARPRGFYWGLIGVYLGQVVALCLLIPAGGVPIMPAFVGVLIFGTVPAVVGALVGAGIGFCIRALRQRIP